MKQTATAVKREYPKPGEAIINSVPKLAYREAMQAWFVYQGTAHNVRECNNSTFKAWVTSITPQKWSREKKLEHVALVASPEDEKLLSRWYTLESFKALNVPGLQLYNSREEAEKACNR
jgi:hypothetical protein